MDYKAHADKAVQDFTATKKIIEKEALDLGAETVKFG
jgi:hypothetical protein